MNQTTTHQQKTPTRWQANRGKDDARRIVSRSPRLATLDVGMFTPLVESRTLYELGIAAWSCGHPPSAYVASLDVAFSVSEIRADDAAAIVRTCLENWSKPLPLVADAVRVRLMKLGAWWDVRDCPNFRTLPLRAWSEHKLCNLFQRDARTVADIGCARLDVYLHAVGNGFRRNVELLRQVHADERRITDALRFTTALARAERPVSP